MNRPTQLLSSHTRNRQHAAVSRADAAGAAADRAVLAVWRHLLRFLRDHDRNPWTARTQARVLFAPLAHNTAIALGNGLRSLAWWGWKTARAGIRQAVPTSALARSLTEDEGNPSRRLFDLLFPPPTERDIFRLMGDGWFQQLVYATRLATPDTLAAIVGGGYAAGKDQKEIAKDLLPAVNGVRVSARRVARTEGMRIAHATQMAMHEQLGDLVIGYSIHATLDSHTRPEHAARSGLVWYKDSGVPMRTALKMDMDTLPDGFN